jgi:DNA-directed RNA polymerase subunit RPC12/RpoP
MSPGAITLQREQDLSRIDEDCPSKTHEKGFTCEECRKEFREPILATVSSGGQTRRYYACPRCMAKVQSFKVSIREKDEKGGALSAKPAKPNSTVQDFAECTHFFGYLNKRQKNMPFPDECLTCARMIECLFG